MAILLRGGCETDDPRLDRVPSRDDRNANFPVRAVVAGVPIRRKTWRLDYKLDQGREGACVGFAWTHRRNAEPLRRGWREAAAFDVYRRARQLDEWPGESYEGTSCLAGAKAARERGWISVFRWAWTLDDVLRAVSGEGPVVMATNWYSGMYDPDGDGYLVPSGRVVGGHAWLVRGVDPARERVRMTNTWGRSWGENGDAWARYPVLERLLREDGECCCPTEV